MLDCSGLFRGVTGSAWNRGGFMGWQGVMTAPMVGNPVIPRIRQVLSPTVLAVLTSPAVEVRSSSCTQTTRGREYGNLLAIPGRTQSPALQAPEDEGRTRTEMSDRPAAP